MAQSHKKEGIGNPIRSGYQRSVYVLLFFLRKFAKNLTAFIRQKRINFHGITDSIDVCFKRVASVTFVHVHC